MKLRLQSRYLFTILTLVLLVVCSLSMLLMWQFHNSTERIRDLSSESLQTKLVDRLHDYGVEVGESLASNLAEPLAALDMYAMQQLIGVTLARENISHVLVYNTDGQVVHDGSVANASYAQELASFATSDDSLSGRARMQDGILHLDSPITLDETEIGGVRIGLSLGPIAVQTREVHDRLDGVIHEGTRRNWINVAATTGLFVFLSMLLALYISRGLVLPIRRLAAYASAVGLGNYQASLPTSRTDELGDLARSLHEMSQNLQVTTGEVHYLAYHDSLTRLPNRAQLKQALRQAISRGERVTQSVALLFIDLDDFKRVNDTLGHEAGDQLLTEFALRLRQCLRTGDQLESDGDDEAPAQPTEMIARLGGDEFTVVLESVRESADAAIVAGRILGLLKEPFLLGGQEVVIGASIGITTFPEDGADVDTLLRNADVAMYQAKERGKNHFEFYNDSMHRMATERLSLETDLRHAIEYDQIRLLYQPVLDARTNEIVGIEARVRWIHPALGGILPAVFVPLAEQTGYIVELDEWVINRACADLALLREHGFSNFTLAVKLASVHFRDQSISQTLLRALQTNELDAQRLALEINEKTIMRNFPRASAMLTDLRGRGVEVWIDEFGSGHSPLSVLPKMPVNGLKIDSDYIAQITTGSHERAIVSTIVAMAHSLNLRVISEGVENQEQIEILREIGCDYVQGSLFVRPMLLDDLVTYLERGATGAARVNQTGTFGPMAIPSPGALR